MVMKEKQQQQEQQTRCKEKKTLFVQVRVTQSSQFLSSHYLVTILWNN